MKKSESPLMMLLLAGAIACNKKAGLQSDITANVSASDAADIVGSSLSANSNGFASVSDDVTVNSQVYVNAHLGCGVTKTDTITKKKPGKCQCYL